MATLIPMLGIQRLTTLQSSSTTTPTQRKTDKDESTHRPHLKLIVEQNSLVEVESTLQDGVGDGGGVVERGWLPAVLLDLSLDVVGDLLLDDGSAFVADEEHLRLHISRRVGHVVLNGFVDAGVDTAAKT